MESNIVLVVGPEELEAARSFQTAFEEQSIPMEVNTLPADGELPTNPAESENCLLWLTPRTGMEVYELGRARKERGLPTLNVLPERFAFTPEQRDCVGRNPAVMLALTKGDVVDAVMKRLGKGGGTARQAAPHVGSVEVSEPVTAVSAELSDNTMPESADADIREAGYGPWPVLIAGIVLFVIWEIGVHLFDLTIDSFWAYVWTGGCGIVAWAFTSLLQDWRKVHGKTIFSWVALIIGWYWVYFYVFYFFRGLYRNFFV